MKKLTIWMLPLLMMAVIIGCGQGQQVDNDEATREADVPAKKQTEEPTATAKPADGAYAINPEASTVGWKGWKPFVENWAHHGTVQLEKGQLVVQDGAITSGEFVIDMTTIDNIDLKEKPEKHQKLVGHLKSDDFFHVAEHPTASFEMTSAEPAKGDGYNYEIIGNLTIKGQTHAISFPAHVEFMEKGLKAMAELTIDRSKWNVKFGSQKLNPGLVDEAKDMVIADEIQITLEVVAPRPG